jgi:hypothetical protein
MHDHFGKPLKEGDRVNIPCVITSLAAEEDFCNVSLESIHGRRPDELKEHVSAINTGVLELITVADVGPVDPAPETPRDDKRADFLKSATSLLEQDLGTSLELMGEGAGECKAVLGILCEHPALKPETEPKTKDGKPSPEAQRNLERKKALGHLNEAVRALDQVAMRLAKTVEHAGKAK